MPPMAPMLDTEKVPPVMSSTPSLLAAAAACRRDSSIASSSTVLSCTECEEKRNREGGVWVSGQVSGQVGRWGWVVPGDVSPCRLRTPPRLPRPLLPLRDPSATPPPCHTWTSLMLGTARPWGVAMATPRLARRCCSTAAWSGVRLALTLGNSRSASAAACTGHAWQAGKQAGWRSHISEGSKQRGAALLILRLAQI